jgi:TetR/AcrR family transcriptional repressor of lmrAB and yxaGH operons
VQQLLSEGGIGPGSLYHHFPQGKAQLVHAVVVAAGNDVNLILTKHLADHPSTSSAIEGWFDVLSASLDDDPRDGCPIAPIALESVNSEPELQAAAAAAYDSWVQTIRERLTLDRWPPDQAQETALAILSLMQGALLLSRTAGDRAALDAAKRSVTRMIGTRPAT